MLKSRLITSKDIKAYLSSTYGHTKEVKSFLRKHRSLKVIELDHHSRSLSHVLYHDTQKNPGRVTAWDVALSFHPRSYLTGYTILSFLGWTEYTPKKVYVNWIRGIRKRAASQTTAIDNEVLQRVAFTPKKIPPVSLRFDDREIIVLSGQYFSSVETKHLIKCPAELDLPKYAMTFRNERLFIEALINYHYFGGPDVVWQALSSRAEHMNQESLQRTFADMNLKYPYANAIGFIIDSSLKNARKASRWLDLVNRDLKFHLFMGDGERRVFVEKWSLYVPKRFCVNRG
jgi:hypothetical protein